MKISVWCGEVMSWSNWLQASILCGLLSFHGLPHLSLCPCATPLGTPTKNDMPTDTTSNVA